MAKSDKELEVFDPAVIISQPDQPPLVLADALQQLGISGPPRKAEELIDQTFTIRRARTFPSKYEGQKYAYFCVCVDTEGELFTTILGGAACTDILDGLQQLAPNRSFVVTLRWKEGGRYEGYYTLE
jgi:hypothetical protein